jgi:hypothetical protein
MKTDFMFKSYEGYLWAKRQLLFCGLLISRRRTSNDQIIGIVY